MINYGIEENAEEMKIASMNLPNKFYLEMDNKYMDSIHSASHLWLFPYSDTVNGDNEDCFTYFSRTTYCHLVAREKDFMKEETILIQLDQIPNEYDYIDVYSIGYADAKSEIEIEFSVKNKKKKKSLFAYKNLFDKSGHLLVTNNGSPNVFIGTLGRVSNGWKFYPTFKNVYLDKKEILQMYITG